MRRKALDEEHVDDDNDRHMIKNMHAFYMHPAHKCSTVPIAWMDFSVCRFCAKDNEARAKKNRNFMRNKTLLRIKRSNDIYVWARKRHTKMRSKIKDETKGMQHAQRLKERGCKHPHVQEREQIHRYTCPASTGSLSPMHRNSGRPCEYIQYSVCVWERKPMQETHKVIELMRTMHRLFLPRTFTLRVSFFRTEPKRTITTTATTKLFTE